MKRKQFTEEQIIAILKESEAGSENGKTSVGSMGLPSKRSIAGDRSTAGCSVSDARRNSRKSRPKTGS